MDKETKPEVNWLNVENLPTQDSEASTLEEIFRGGDDFAESGNVSWKNVAIATFGTLAIPALMALSELLQSYSNSLLTK